MSNIEIVYVLIDNTNYISVKYANLLYRKQNATHYRKKKTNSEFLNEKLEPQIKESFSNVSLIKSVVFEDNIFTFYNVKNRKKNKSKEIQTMLGLDKLYGDIMVFMQDINTLYFKYIDYHTFAVDMKNMVNEYYQSNSLGSEIVSLNFRSPVDHIIDINNNNIENTDNTSENVNTNDTINTSETGNNTDTIVNVDSINNILSSSNEIKPLASKKASATKGKTSKQKGKSGVKNTKPKVPKNKVNQKNTTIVNEEQSSTSKKEEDKEECNTDIELDLECSDLECSDIEFTDDEDATSTTQSTNNTKNELNEDVDIDIEDLDGGDTDVYLDEDSDDDNNGNDEEIEDIDDELDDNLGELEGDDDIDDEDNELETNYNMNLNSSIISGTLIDSLSNSVSDNVEEKKKKKTKSYNFKNNFSILKDILTLEEVSKLTPIKSLNIIRKNNIKILSKIPINSKSIRNIEQGIYNYSVMRCEENYYMPNWESIEFKNSYINKSRTVFSNLVSNNYIGNDYLLNKIKDKSIDCYQIAFMESYNLFPSKWQDIIDEKIKIEQILKNELQGTASEHFKCPKCKARKTIYVQVQTRSADEPMTTFITCLKCGNKWKQ